MSKVYIKQGEMPDCKYNTGVACPDKGRTCDCCGWNPNVDMQRLEEFCETHGLDIKEVLSDEQQQQADSESTDSELSDGLRDDHSA